MLKVSVIVPVYDPGANIDELLGSLLAQTLPREEHEAIFVDDGSTDGTGERLDALAAEHPHVRVEHIPNSGWPSRPRNVGLGLARGEYVFFADNDDRLEHDALERLYARAAADGADVVVGKVVGHGKFVPSGMFRESRRGLTLETGPLLGLLTPHKLFRRAFLEEHGIRFPERPRLEDHVFCLRAYFASDRISILGDRPVYHWIRRDDEGNASLAWDPAEYYARVRDVLDVVDAHTEPGPLRDRLYLHYYRGKVLARVSGRRAPLDRPPEWRAALLDELERLVAERFPERLDARLPFAAGVRAGLLRAGDREGLDLLAAYEAGLRARAKLVEADGALAIEATIDGLAFRRVGSRTLWEPPAGLAERIPPEQRRAGRALRRARLRVALRSLDSGDETVLPADSTREVAADGSLLLRAEAAVDPRRAAAGAALPAGAYHVAVLAMAAGFTAVCTAEGAAPGVAAVLEVDEAGRLARRGAAAGAVRVALARAARRVAGR